jgi:hypothetical protein
MKQQTRKKLLYWLDALSEDASMARQAMLTMRKPDKILKDLRVPFKDSIRNLTGVIETEL